ncbi:hypothetical protein [Spirillospora sp. NPDC047279]|uniref:hypothetical protein n=1 Tax=Spirillospora sp. NPDC047279 TaxID=3155478 RepID=UPI0033EEC6AB
MAAGIATAGVVTALASMVLAIAAEDNGFALSLALLLLALTVATASILVSLFGWQAVRDVFLNNSPPTRLRSTRHVSGLLGLLSMVVTVLGLIPVGVKVGVATQESDFGVYQSLAGFSMMCAIIASIFGIALWVNLLPVRTD